MARLLWFTKLLVLLICSISVTAQSPADFRAKLDTLINENNQNNSNIQINANYGTDKQLCRISISEKYSLRDEQSGFVINGESQTKGAAESRKEEKNFASIYWDIINNLPSSLRFGKLIEDFGSSVGNCFTRWQKVYENVNVESGDYICGSDYQFRNQIIEWKREECRNNREEKR